MSLSASSTAGVTMSPPETWPQRESEQTPKGFIEFKYRQTHKHKHL